MSKKCPLAEPSLRLLVIDFGDGCIIKCEQGDFNQIDAAALLVTGSTCMDNVAITSYSFPELQQSIDAHFADTLPRLVATRGEDGLYRQPDNYYGVDLRMMGEDGKEYGNAISNDQYNALNELARQAGATRNLEIYEPKGRWTYQGGKWNDIAPDETYTVWRYER